MNVLLHPTVRVRTPEVIERDLEEAKRDLDDDLAAIAEAVAREDYEAADEIGDRASASETRFHDLQDEYHAKLAEAGFSIERLNTLFERALI